MEKYLNLFLKNNILYYNYSLDKKFKFQIYKNKIILFEKKSLFIFYIYSKIYISTKKNIQKRWEDINKVILKKKGNVNFLLFYSIKSN